MALQIVTGHRGEDHISSDDVQGLLRGIVGTNLRVFRVGQMFAAEMEGANTLRIHDGELCYEGVHARIPYGQSDTVAISNGAADYDRIDYVTIHYEKDTSTGVESVSWVYRMGGSDGSPPDIESAISLVEGATVMERAMFIIQFDRLTPSVSPNFGLCSGLAQEGEDIAEIAADVAAALRAAQYRPGDTDTLQITPAAGEVYNSGRTLRFLVPFARTPVGVSSVTVTGGSFFVRGKGKVLRDTTNFADVSKTVQLYKNGIMITISKDGQFPGLNYEAVIVNGTVSVRFS